MYVDNVNATDLHTAADFVASLNNHTNVEPVIKLTYDAVAVYTVDDDQYATVVSLLGGNRQRRNGTAVRPPHFARSFEGFEIRVHPPSNTESCRKVPTGKKIKEHRYPEGVEPVEVEVDEYVWECDPVLPKVKGNVEQ